MKKLSIIFAALLMSAAALSAQNAKSIYNKYSEVNDVTTVYLSPMMLSMLGDEGPKQFGPIDIVPFVNSLSGIYIISSENTHVNKSLENDVKKMVNSGKYEVMMEVKEDEETVRIYTLTKGDFVTNFVLLAVESDECTFISMNGKISKDDISKLAGQINSDL